MANALSGHLRGLDESSCNLQNQSAPPHSGTTHPGDGQAIDSTTAKAHRSAAGGKGARKRRRLGTTKIHAIVDARGRPIAIEVTPGHLGDVRVATALITGVPGGGCLAADAAYDSDGLRRFLLERGTVPVIPNNPTRKRTHPFDTQA